MNIPGYHDCILDLQVEFFKLINLKKRKPLLCFFYNKLTYASPLVGVKFVSLFTGAVITPSSVHAVVCASSIHVRAFIDVCDVII